MSSHLPLDLDQRIQNLARIQHDTATTREKTFGSTRRIVNLFEQCQDAGVNTLVSLHTQREKLNGVEGNLNGIQHNLKNSEKVLTEMTNTEKCCCAISCCVFSCNKKHKEKNPALWTPQTTQKSTAPKSTFSDSINSKNKKAVQFVKVGQSHKGMETEKEIGNNLDQVSNMVKNLKKIAIDLNDEVSTGNEQLDRLNNKAQSNNVRLSSLTKRSGKLLRMNSSWCDCCCTENSPTKSPATKLIVTKLRMI